MVVNKMPGTKLKQLSAKEKYLSKLALINVLKKCSPQVRIELIGYLNSDGINVLSEITNNVFYNKPPLNQRQYKTMKKFYLDEKKTLRDISRKKASLKKKRDYFRKQSGGFLGTLLGKATNML